MKDLTKAINSLYPLAEWTLDGDKYEGLTWLSPDITKPTLEELEAECDRLEQIWINNQYQRNRAKEYPSIINQLDMLYHDKLDGTTTWQDAIQAIKDKYPKP